MTNADQKTFWSESAGPVWVTMRSQMDALLTPVQNLLLETADLQPGARVLDVGCGTGASTAAAAENVQAKGHACGMDFSSIMLERARAQYKAYTNVSWLLADAQTYHFEQGAFDAIISRLGMMFFEDSVAALSNLRRALAPNGQTTFTTWGPARDNPWFVEAARAATDVLGPVPKVDRTLPGPFAFEDISRVIELMTMAGWKEINSRSVEINLTPSGGLGSTAELCCRIGPADSALQYHAASTEQRKDVSQAIVERFARFDTPHGLQIPAVINVFKARSAH